MICKNCASPINEDSSFCSVCGQKTENAAPAEVTPDTAPENIVAPVNNSSPTPASEPKKKDMSKLLTVIISVVLSVIASVATTMIMNGDKKDVTVNNNNNTVYENEINEEDTTLAVEEEEEITTEMPTEPTTEASIESLLIGEWELVSQVDGDGNPLDKEINPLVLYEDGTCTLNGVVGEWKIFEDELMVFGSVGGHFFGANAFVGKFSCDGNTLKIREAQIDGNDYNANFVYNRKY